MGNARSSSTKYTRPEENQIKQTSSTDQVSSTTPDLLYSTGFCFAFLNGPSDGHELKYYVPASTPCAPYNVSKLLHVTAIESIDVSLNPQKPVDNESANEPPEA